MCHKVPKTNEELNDWFSWFLHRDVAKEEQMNKRARLFLQGGPPNSEQELSEVEAIEQ